MSLRFLALALLAIWAPAALAFPPCPKEPVELEPIDGDDGATTASQVSPWFRGQYALVGDPTIIDQIKPFQRLPKTGKCRDYDNLPVPGPNSDYGDLGPTPRYAPISGFGVIALPDLRYIGRSVNVSYLLDFKVDNARLASGDWFDIVELQYRWQESSPDPTMSGASAIYRVRKRQNNNREPVLEVIAAETSSAVVEYPLPSPHVIATIPMTDKSGYTRIALRFSQARKGDAWESAQPTTTDASAGLIGIEPVSIVPLPTIESTLEVLDVGNKVVGSVVLPNQWANELSMGLLNYNVGTPLSYPTQVGVKLQSMSLAASEF